MFFAFNQLFCVYNSCQNNENNMSDSNIEYTVLKVHTRDIMFARDEYLQSFWKSVVSTAKHPDRTHLGAFKSLVN